ncbi:hypothetical protein PHLGIDRAFT_370345 [Phlebiopsis gigantea 11061_1 CR5-6]|uniref:Uncharacterized protein n=1 Tax=Phlebiopsis gigantea (strain 11061_1 CR5-6) TaxID=745531 RepID=A0A0C3P2L7_PHLG1|nr:hypothetical protein PHLGIDRAFT_370345 [Phlebiopsis gigantea 11061_1 CR5-6]
MHYTDSPHPRVHSRSEKLEGELRTLRLTAVVVTSPRAARRRPLLSAAMLFVEVVVRVMPLAVVLTWRVCLPVAFSSTFALRGPVRFRIESYGSKVSAPM